MVLTAGFLPANHPSMSASEYRYSRPAALLETVGGDRTTFLLLIDIFKRDTADKLAKLREALAHGDRAQLAFNTHALKGTVGPTGADALFARLVELEHACRSPEGVFGDDAIADVERQVRQILVELE